MSMRPSRCGYHQICTVSAPAKHSPKRASSLKSQASGRCWRWSMPRYSYRPCNCGSGEIHEPQFDGHGIFLKYTCSKCEKEAMAGYRPDIHERYECDEPIEAEDY